ncbi:hypothetical protein [Pleomorphomonas oryzae]|uniref:hypothetical protein n=1 Tax=Pleomorphomonas oryzae TaxID=261934 RepID=UPI0006856F3A|nr:hypothetical protein [Pleomorphomonas oryzae]
MFFLDEAVALAAGHRPCGRCRAEALKLFRSCWKTVHGFAQDAVVSTRAIDYELHAGRLRVGGKATYRARFGDLPKGAFVVLASSIDANSSRTPSLLWNGKAYPWTHAGYCEPVEVHTGTMVDVLTPRPIVEVLKAGYSELVLPKLSWEGT